MKYIFSILFVIEFSILNAQQDSVLIYSSVDLNKNAIEILFTSTRIPDCQLLIKANSFSDYNLKKVKILEKEEIYNVTKKGITLNLEFEKFENIYFDTLKLKYKNDTLKYAVKIFSSTSSLEFKNYQTFIDSMIIDNESRLNESEFKVCKIESKPTQRIILNGKTEYYLKLGQIIRLR